MSLKIHENIKNKLNKFIETNRVPNLLINGPHSSGKKTIVFEFINNIYKNDINLIKKYVMILNCTQDKGIKMIREDLKFFSKTNTPNIYINENLSIKFKTIILLNAEYLTIDAQSALRRSMELYNHSTRFILVVVSKEKVLNPILSRVCDIYIPIPSINNKLIDLNNQKQIDILKKMNLEKNKRLELKLKELILEPKKLNNLQVRNLAVELYEDGFYLKNILFVIEKKLFNLLKLERKKYLEILIILSNMKEYTISETLLIFNALFMIFISSNIKIENIVFN